MRPRPALLRFSFLKTVQQDKDAAMNSRFFSLLLLTCVVGLMQIGCGDGGSTVGTPDDDPQAAFANTVKNDVIGVLRDGDIEVLPEIFEDVDSSQAGPHASTIDQLMAGAAEMQSLSGAAQKAKIDELTKLAMTLPGDLSEIEDEDGGGDDGDLDD